MPHVPLERLRSLSLTVQEAGLRGVIIEGDAGELDEKHGRLTSTRRGRD